MQGHQLITLEDVKLSHIHSGKETVLFESGSLALTLVDVPGSRPTSRPASPIVEKGRAPPIPPRPGTPARDQWLLMSLTPQGASEPAFELPVPSQSRIVTAPPSSYIIPNTSDPSAEDAGFIKLTLPSTISTEQRETFEATLWNLTSFSSSPAATTDTPPSYADPSLRSKLVLVDPKSGQVLGALSASTKVSEDPSLGAEGQGEHEKEPVVIEAGVVSGTTTPGGSAFDFTARPLSSFEPTYNPTNSSIISAADWISRGIVVGAEVLGRTFESGADKFVSSRPATTKPMVFSPATCKKLETGNMYTGKAVQVSGKVAGMIGGLAAKAGDRVGRATGIQGIGGKTPSGIKGLVNSSLVAFNTVTDSLETSGKHLLATGSTSTTKVVHHAYGPDAADASRKFGGSIQHVALVYIDARGVTRKALLTSLGKSAIRAKMADGREVILSQDGKTDQVQVEQPANSTGLETVGEKERREAEEEKGKKKVA